MTIKILIIIIKFNALQRIIVMSATQVTAPRQFTEVDYTLQQYIPNAQLILYPGSGHGSQFQYPQLFVLQAARFLDAPDVQP